MSALIRKKNTNFDLVKMGKILAIDFGLRRTGLALSDEMQQFAFGHSTVDSKTLHLDLQKLIPQEGVSEIVLGLPKRLNQEDSHITENVRLLHESLTKAYPELKVELYDERFTSKMASQSISMLGGSKKAKKDKGLIDKVSATILLQSYLQSRLYSGF